MSSAYLNKQISKTKAKKRAYTAFSTYMRMYWNMRGSVLCYTCGNVTFYKERPGKRTMVGHWVEGHSNVSYINEVYVRPQCYRCNMMMGGNQGEFRDRIRKEIGSETTDRLLMEARQTKDISVLEYLDLEGYYKHLISKLTSSKGSVILKP